MISHEHFEKLIPLYVYGDLEPGESEKLEEHLHSCDACTQQLGDVQALHQRLGDKIALEPTEATLGELRSKLRSRLRDEQTSKLRERWWQRALDSLQLQAPGLQLIGALGILLLGLLVGRFVWTNPSPEVTNPEVASSSAGVIVGREPLIENIDLIEYEPTSGNVTIRYKSVNDVLMQGQVDDARIREILAHAIRSEVHPGRRLAAVKAFSSRSFNDEQVEKALIHAVENDTVDGVRLRAAKVLKSLPITPDIKMAFIRVLLKDPNPALRMEAVEALSKVREPEDVIPIFHEASTDDDNEFIRLKATRELERRSHPQFGQDDRKGERWQ